MTGSQLPSGTVTFVFTDIEGSTSMTQEFGDHMRAVLDRHHRLLGDAVSGGGGTVIRIAGDGLFCVFESAVGAVSAAVDAQRALAANSWPEGMVVRVRMGIHTGEGVLGGDSYVGLDVHRAARIGAAGHGGQVLLSQATTELVSGDLPCGVALRDLGPHELKDLGRTERLHELAIDGLEQDFPPVRSLRASSGRLPVSLTRFIGRREELAAISSLIDRPGLMTLLGPGGSGKTRLAIEAARVASGEFEALHFVDLSAASNPELLSSFVAEAMSIVDSASTPPHELVSAHIAASRFLLVVDNCEHMSSEAARLIAYLLAECPRLTVLATSRQSLAVAGEQLLPVRGLTVESDDHRDAVEMFVDRASAVSRDFDADRWSTDVEELCRRLDGIPLAIELAAARTNALTPRGILDHLGDRFALLKSPSPTALPRHRSIEAAISWSYDTLDPGEQSFLRRVSVFRGGFTLEAAAKVGADPGVELTETDVVNVLSSLIAKSFVFFRVHESGERYDLLETVREYLAARLEGAGESTTAAALHRDYFLDWARVQAGRLGTGDQLAALDELEADHSNLRRVLERSVETDDREPALAMAATLVWFWYVHSHFTEGNYWSNRLLAHRQEPPTRAAVRLMIGAGDFDFRLGEHDRATARFSAALEGARRLGSDSLAMWALAYMATNDALSLRLDEASASLAEASRIAGELSDFLGAGYCVFMDASIRGWIAVQNDELDLLPPLLEELDALVDLVRSAGERNMIGHVMQTVGLMSYWMGRETDARLALEESLIAFSEIKTLACTSHCLEAVAVIVAESRPASAIELLAGCESARDRIGIKTPPLERELRRLAADAAEPQLGAEALDGARNRGHGLTLPEATALAHQALVGPAGVSSGKSL